MTRPAKAPVVFLNGRAVGGDNPCYITAEIGINHNGDLALAKRMIDAAVDAGCDAVKFQKRTPELCVPEHQKNVQRETPWGVMTYLDYRHRVEFGEREYRELDRYCKEKRVQWFASIWDEKSVDFMELFDPPAYKIPSAHLTNDALLAKVKRMKRPVVLSTGMSSQAEVDHAVKLLGEDNLVLCHTVSTYPAEDAELNLRVVQEYQKRYRCVIGYSGHERGVQCSVAAVALGAKFLERHLTTDRTLWGTDQAASLEPQGMRLLVRDARAIEGAMGDGIKRVLDSELPVRKKLRGV